MKVFREYRQDQNFLLPPSLDEFAADDHEVRIINDVVDAMDLSLLLDKYEGGGGVPPFLAPLTMRDFLFSPKKTARYVLLYQRTSLNLNKGGRSFKYTKIDQERVIPHVGKLTG